MLLTIGGTKATRTTVVASVPGCYLECYYEVVSPTAAAPPGLTWLA